jgi:hypothetical protein
MARRMLWNCVLLVVGALAACSVGTAGPAAAGATAVRATTAAATAAIGSDQGTLLRSNVGLYPRLVRSADGTILASVVTFDGNNGLGAIYASHDGRTFAQVGTIADPASGAGKGLCCATLYELPRRVGALPAGTLLWASSAGQDSGADRRMSIRIFASRDHGRTWAYLATPAVAPNNLGLWEPEFTVSTAGRLVVFFSDETDQPAHSQMLVSSTSADGIHWSSRLPVVAGTDPAARPGMAIVRRIAGGRYLMSYEICGGSYGCRVHYRQSLDGLHWGNPADLGPTITAADGTYFAHTPNITWAPTSSANGRLYLVGQILDNPDGTTAAGNGHTVLYSDHGPAGPWNAIAAPVAVPEPYDNYCPNYSSPLLTTNSGLLEIATAYDTDGVCKAYYGSTG